MNETYLLTRPEHDDTTYYLSQWVKGTVEYAQRKGIKVIDLHRQRARKQEVESLLESQSPKLVVLNGHGDNESVRGHNNELLITAGQNESLLASKIVYAISCSSAKSLGPKSVSAGAISYIGYDDDFIFLYDPAKFSRPLQDETAGFFLQPSRLFIESIIKGNAVSEARKKCENMLKDTLKSLLGGNRSDASIARYLWWDLKHFVSHGDADATI
ncbi:MAG: hypothetical protein AABX69_00010 [Nanoarchaeota archaeon]